MDRGWVFLRGNAQFALSHEGWSSHRNPVPISSLNQKWIHPWWRLGDALNGVCSWRFSLGSMLG